MSVGARPGQERNLLWKMGGGLEAAKYTQGLNGSHSSMRIFSRIVLVFIVVLVVQGYAKDAVSAQLLHARYVALGYETANGFLGEWETEAFNSAKVLPEDRQALAHLSEALKKWNRYLVTIEPQQAEILIAVRSGRLASAGGGIRVHTGSIDPGGTMPGGRGIGPVVGAEAGPRPDYLALYQAEDGREGPRLWRKTEDGGLAGAIRRYLKVSRTMWRPRVRSPRNLESRSEILETRLIVAFQPCGLPSEAAYKFNHTSHSNS